MITVSLAAVRRLVPHDPTLRILTSVTLVNTLGNGMFLTTSALFFTRSAGLSIAQLGLALTLAGVCGVLAGVPMGRLADRWGARGTLVLLVTIEAAGMLGYTVTHSFATLVPLLCAVTFVDRGASAVRNALVGTALKPEARVHGRAYLRAVTNAGMGAGSAIAAIALHYNTREAYLTMVVANAATFLLAAVLLIRLPADRPTPSHGTRSRAKQGHRRALKDPPYLLITALTGALAMQFGMVEVGIPLWVVHDTKAPRLIISAVLVLNTVLVVVLQVRASRGTEDPRRAARLCGRSGVLLALACVAIGAAHGVPAVVAVVVLLVGAVLQTFGEMLSSAAGWALGYDLAPPGATGEYQGVFNSGFAAGMLLGPLLVTSTALRFGLPGWLCVGAIFLVTGAALSPATRWALARNENQKPTTPSIRRVITMHSNAEHVATRLRELGVDGEIRELPEPAPTAATAASQLGCEVGAIANSLVFAADGEPLLVLTSGAHRVDTAKIAALVGVVKVKRADPQFVRTATGQPIGGVGPIGHPAPIRTLVDEWLARHDVVWAAAGHPHTVFPTNYAELLRITGGTATQVE